MSNLLLLADAGDNALLNNKAYRKKGTTLGVPNYSTQPGDETNLSGYTWNYDDDDVSGGSNHRVYSADEYSATRIIGNYGQGLAGNGPAYCYSPPVAGVVRIWLTTALSFTVYVNGVAASVNRAANGQAEAIAVKVLAGDVITCYSGSLNGGAVTEAYYLFWPFEYEYTIPSFFPDEHKFHFTMDNISGATLTNEVPVIGDGTITGATQVSGVSGNALNFVANQYVTVPYNSHYFYVSPDAPVSCSCFINFTTVGASGWQRIFTVGNWDEQITLHVNGGKLTFIILHHWGDRYLAKTSVATLSNDTTYHVGMSYDGSRTAGGIQLYINGIKLTDVTTNDTLSGATPNTAYPLYIGNSSDSSNEFLNGWIDEFHMSTRVYSESEMLYLKQLYMP